MADAIKVPSECDGFDVEARVRSLLRHAAENTRAWRTLNGKMGTIPCVAPCDATYIVDEANAYLENAILFSTALAAALVAGTGITVTNNGDGTFTIATTATSKSAVYGRAVMFG